MEAGRPQTLLRISIAAILLLAATAGVPGSARGLVGDSRETFGLDGSIRTLFFVLDQNGAYPFSAGNNLDVLSQSILRLAAGGKPTDSLSYEIHFVQSATLSTANISGGSPLAFGNANTGNVLRYRALGANWDVVQEDRALANSSFDRFNVKAAFAWGDVTVGRQAITFGKTYFWNPLDVFFPFGSNQFDRDYKPGVDAVKVDVPFGLFSGMTVVGAGGPRIRIASSSENGNDPRDASWYGSALMGRIFANKSGWDFSIEGGKVYGGYQAGVAAVGDVGPVQLRGEIAQFLALPSDPLPAPLKGDLVTDAFLAVFGAGHRFENSLSLDFEYFYNGAGDPNNLNAALVRTQYGASLQMSRHLTGLTVRYDLTPLVVGQLAIINSLSDGSTELQPLVTISLTNEMDLILGTMFNFGPPPKKTTVAGATSVDVQSEFGTAPDMFFFEWKFYF